MASVNDLTSAATAGARPGLSGIGSTELAALITAASEAITKWLGYPLYRRTAVTETCIGGAQRLFLKAGAIQSLTSVVCFGDTWDADDYALEDDIKGVIRSNVSAFPFTGRRGPGVSEAPLFRDDTGDIIVIHSCGWVTPGQVALDGALTRDLPQALEEACILTLLAWPRGRDVNVVSESLGDGSRSYGSGTKSLVPLAARTMISEYRKHVR